ncbi:MAG: hypothetical protein ACWGN7_07725 [Thermodesulfovibrionales bacterium]
MASESYGARVHRDAVIPNARKDARPGSIIVEKLFMELRAYQGIRMEQPLRLGMPVCMSSVRGPRSCENAIVAPFVVMQVHNPLEY